MSRKLSAAALKNVLLPDSDATLLVLLTLTGKTASGNITPIRICDGYTTRLQETYVESDPDSYEKANEEIIYGVKCGLYASYNTTFSITNGGSGYNLGDLITVPGTSLGGTASNNLRLTVAQVGAGGAATKLEFADDPGKKVADAKSVTNIATVTESEEADGTGVTVNVTTIKTDVVEDFTFLPVEIVLPSEQTDALPTANIVIHDVTRYVLPHLRQLIGPPSVLLQVVLNSTPGILEADFAGLKLASVDYNKDTISGKLVVDGLETEPFPCHAFLPSSFPGLF